MAHELHICREEDADTIIAARRTALGQPDLPAEKKHVPDVMVYAYDTDLSTPVLVNLNKVCVVMDT